MLLYRFCHPCPIVNSEGTGKAPIRTLLGPSAPELVAERHTRLFSLKSPFFRASSTAYPLLRYP